MLAFKLKEQYVLEECPFCGGFPAEIESEYSDRNLQQAREALQKHVRDHLVSVALILAPVEVSELEDETCDTKSDSRIDNTSERDLNEAGAICETECQSDSCDCKAGKRTLGEHSGDMHPNWQIEDMQLVTHISRTWEIVLEKKSEGNSEDETLRKFAAKFSQSAVLRNGSPSIASFIPESSLADLQAQLWEQAYDDLKIDELDLVKAYERLLSSKLGVGGSRPARDRNENDVESTHKTTKSQIKQLSALVDKNLTTKIFADPGDGDERLRTLQTAIFQLYRMLLLHQMKIVCGYNRDKAILSSLSLKPNNWNEEFDEIRQAEDAVLRYLALYSSERFRSDLQSVKNRANRQLAHMLKVSEELESAILMQKGGQKGYKNERDQRLLPHLVLTDPREDKKITVDAKGGLLKDSHQWILEHSDFKKWVHDKGCRLLWIQGGPGRGKTMLLCGIIDELSETPNLLSFFLCQGSNPDQHSAAAVLRGLIHVLISRQPALTRHIDEEHGEAVQELFEDSKAFPKLAQIFTRMLEDSLASTCYLVIDGLNECIADLGLLLDFIANRTADSPAKWIVSSRNWPRIAEAFDLGDAALTISLEVVDRDFQHNTMVFINRSMEQLTMLRDLETAEAEACAEMIRHELRTKANGTLLWVAVVVQQLQNTEYWNLQSVKKFFDNTPSDLQSFLAIPN
ncbi:NACHT-domain-containing protein [Colletotrichum sp. SAR11_239]|nr:NACHT-domain-containing protein [Colletotrichum sp. SAR11_239]